MNRTDVVLPQYNRRSSSSTATAKLPISSITSSSRDALHRDVMTPQTKPEASTSALGPVVEREEPELEPRPGGWFGRLPRVTWLFSAYFLTGIIAVTWLAYCCVRYTRAAQGEPLLGIP